MLLVLFAWPDLVYLSSTIGDLTRAETFSLTIKSLKPPVSFALENVAGTDSVLSIKERLAAEHSRAPSVDVSTLR